MSEETVRHELSLDLLALAAAETEGKSAFRVWSIDQPVVVVGRSVEAANEVDIDFCHNNGIAIVARPSGGRSVLIGLGTVQYSYTLPYSLDEELNSIAGSKTFCNRLMRTGAQVLSELTEDSSGDLVRGNRKIAGLALKRGRNAVLLHGTILVDADLELIALALRHPEREPDYRDGRSHLDFLGNLGALDSEELERRVRHELAVRVSTSTASR
jgi:lipoate-protein ligase A